MSGSGPTCRSSPLLHSALAVEVNKDLGHTWPSPSIPSQGPCTVGEKPVLSRVGEDHGHCPHVPSFCTSFSPPCPATPISGPDPEIQSHTVPVSGLPSHLLREHKPLTVGGGRRGQGAAPHPGLTQSLRAVRMCSQGQSQLCMLGGCIVLKSHPDGLWELVFWGH